MPPALKKIIFAIFVLVLLQPTLVIAQNPPFSTNNAPVYNSVQGSIKDYLCTPSEPADGQDLERCINKAYRFGVAFGALALVFFIVLAGYFYIIGGESGKERGKGILKNGLVGIIILLGSYALLNFINPDLTTFKPIQPPIFDADAIPDCEAIGFGSGCAIEVAEPGGDFSVDVAFTGSYKACGRSFSNPTLEAGKVKTIPVKVWDLSGSSKVTKTMNVQVHECIVERTKKAFEDYYNSPDKIPIKSLGGYGIRNIAGTSTVSAHAFGLTIDINPVENCHANNNGVCKKKEWFYRPCPGSNCSPYSIPGDSGLVKAFKANGFGWGGNWRSSKDYMHVSCVENEQGKCS